MSVAASVTPPLVVVGVSGSGKSTVGGMLGKRLGMPFIDGDDLHTTANKAKMAASLLDEIVQRLRRL